MSIQAEDILQKYTVICNIHWSQCFRTYTDEFSSIILLVSQRRAPSHQSIAEQSVRHTTTYANIHTFAF